MAAALLLPLVELFVAIQVGRSIGGLAVFGLLVLGSALGMLVIQRQGRSAWQAVRSSAQTGTPPNRNLADAAVLMLAGLLLIIPGFVTDAVALLLLLPFTRPLARKPIEQFFRRAAADQVTVRTAYVNGQQFRTSAPGQPRFGPGFGRSDVVEGEIVDDERRS
nr:FxsA family protein [Kineosporia babensis]